MLSIIAEWWIVPGSEREAVAALAQLAAAVEQQEPFTAKYPLLTDWPQMYYGGNYYRLLPIKQAADPDGILAFQQGIGSAFRPGGAEPLDLSPLNRTQTLRRTRGDSP